jgi:uncharacterized protein (TIGR00369 family)
MFRYPIDVAVLNRQYATFLVQLMGLEFTDATDSTLSARMPVDERTWQAFGILHGGASVVLAETVGSVAANHCVDFTQQFCVGLEINANHIRSVRSGWVEATARPLHLGSSTQVWDIPILDIEGRLVCASRLTMAVRSRQQASDGKPLVHEGGTLTG